MYSAVSFNMYCNPFSQGKANHKKKRLLSLFKKNFIQRVNLYICLYNRIVRRYLKLEQPMQGLCLQDLN